MKNKSDDYKLNAVDYYLTEDKSQEEVCKIFKCSQQYPPGTQEYFDSFS